MSVMLASLNQVKDILRIAHAETSLDSVLTQAIQNASAKAERVAGGRSFTYNSYANESYKGGGYTIALKNYPVDSNASFDVKDYDATNNTIIFDTSDYAVDFETGIITLRGGIRFTHGPDSARVSYAAGYHPTGTGADTRIDVPDDLQEDVRDYAVAIYRRQSGSISQDDFVKIKDELEGGGGFMRHARLW